MKFSEIAELFDNLETRSKRLEKILILRDFFLINKKEGAIIFDIIAGNFQREINKKKLGISIKTIFAVLSFLSKKSELQIERKFNQIGDLGQIASEILEDKKQKSLQTFDLTLGRIMNALNEIAQITGTNSNRRKKEILSNLFLATQSQKENKFLARLLIDDLRIGVSEGVLREAMANAYFPQIIDIHLMCSKCNYMNLNLKNCLNCSSQLDLSDQEEILKKSFSVVELEVPKKEVGLLKYDIEYEINPLEYALRRDRNRQILKSKNPRELYNTLLKNFEKKYNLLNSFRKVSDQLDKSLDNCLKFEIEVGNPIKAMLGTRAKNVEDSFDMTSVPAFIDFKYDGLRIQIHNNHGNVRLFTRNLDEITKQFPEVTSFIKTNFKDESFVIDSECVGYDFDEQKFLPFQTLTRRILTKNLDEVSHINVVVKAFDMLYLNGETLIEESYEKRRDTLNNLYLKRPIRQKLHFDVEKLKEIGKKNKKH